MGINKAILVGNLGRDPEIRFTNDQKPVATISIATGERRKDAASGGWVNHTEWHRVVAFGRLAEFAQNYLKKGRHVYIEGKIRTNKWQDKEGRDRYTTEILANDIQFVGGRNSEVEMDSGYQGNSSQQGFGASANAAMSSLKPADSIAAPAAVPFDDDDIPF